MSSFPLSFSLFFFLLGLDVFVIHRKRKDPRNDLGEDPQGHRSLLFYLFIFFSSLFNRFATWTAEIQRRFARGREKRKERKRNQRFFTAFSLGAVATREMLCKKFIEYIWYIHLYVSHLSVYMYTYIYIYIRIIYICKSTYIYCVGVMSSRCYFLRLLPPSRLRFSSVCNIVII